MNSIQSSKRRFFAWALLLSILFPAGILMIIFGFTKGMLYIAIPGIVLTVAGFYVMPVLWINFGTRRYYETLHQQITVDGIRKISLLAEMNGKNAKQTAADIRYLISHRFLPRYVILENEFLVDKEETQDFDAYVARRQGGTAVVKCPSCGADVELVDGLGRCAYCGRPVTDKDKK